MTEAKTTENLLWRDLPDEVTSVLEHVESFSGRSREIRLAKDWEHYEVAMAYCRGAEGASFIRVVVDTDTATVVTMREELQTPTLAEQCRGRKK